MRMKSTLLKILVSVFCLLTSRTSDAQEAKNYDSAPSISIEVAQSESSTETEDLAQEIQRFIKSTQNRIYKIPRNREGLSEIRALLAKARHYDKLLAQVRTSNPDLPSQMWSYLNDVLFQYDRIEQHVKKQEQRESAKLRQKKLEEEASRLVETYRSQIDNTNLPSEFLESRIVLQMVGSTQTWLTPEKWIALLLRSGNYINIQGMQLAGRQDLGVRMKRRGERSRIIYFENDGSELFVSHFGVGNDVVPVRTLPDHYQVNIILLRSIH